MRDDADARLTPVKRPPILAVGPLNCLSFKYLQYALLIARPNLIMFDFHALLGDRNRRKVVSLSDFLAESLPLAIIEQLVVSKATSQGVKLSKRESRGIASKLRAGQATIYFRQWRFWDKRKLTLDITSEDIAELSAIIDDNRLTELLTQLGEDVGNFVLVKFERDWNDYWRVERRQQAGFRRRLQERWGAPLTKMRMLLALTLEAGAKVNQRLRTTPTESPNLVEVITRLHARSCQIFYEVLTLLEAGFADGAMARWRTLHEVSVVAIFISQHGDELAQRYMDHEFVETLKAAKEYRTRQERLGFEPIDGEYIHSLKQKVDELILQYKKSFGTQYGWASLHLNNDSPKISDIEQSIGNDYMRPYYRMASHNVHANPKGAFFRMGLLEESEVLLAGASNTGLQEPGQNAALSLLKSTTSLLTLKPTLDELVALKAMVKLVDEIEPAFAIVAEEIRERSSQTVEQPDAFK